MNRLIILPSSSVHVLHGSVSIRTDFLSLNDIVHQPDDFAAVEKSSWPDGKMAFPMNITK